MNHSITPPEAEGAAAGNGVGRRTLLAGAAWTIPAISLATATPAAAASTTSPQLVWVSSRISRDPSWNGQNPQGQGYVDAGEKMVADYVVTNQGDAPVEGYSVSIDLLAGTLHGAPTAPAGFVLTGQTQYVSGSQTRYVYTFTTAATLDPGETASVRLSYQLADGNSILNAYGNPNGDRTLGTNAIGYVSNPDGTRVRTDFLDTQLGGTPTYVIRY